MESNIGKICPFCKTEIKEEDAVKICPSCGIPHHEGCWEENKGCTTFGCSEKSSEPQSQPAVEVCAKCGAPLGEGQGFCIMCGAPRNAPKNVCGKCGAQLQDGQAFCPVCGQRVGLAVDANVGAAINQFNASVEKKQKKTKTLPIILAAILVACIGIGSVVMKNAAAKRAEEARDQYINDVRLFLVSVYDAGTNLEDIADTIQRYWYESIWEDKHGDDIETAVFLAQLEMSEEIDEAEVNDAALSTLYSKVKSIPSEVPEEDEEELKDICSAVKDLYDVYEDFYTLAMDPSGNYTSYRDNNSELTDEFIDCFKEVEKLVE